MIMSGTEENKKGDCWPCFRCIKSEINLIQKKNKIKSFILPVQINYKLNHSWFLVLSYEKDYIIPKKIRVELADKKNYLSGEAAI